MAAAKASKANTKPDWSKIGPWIFIVVAVVFIGWLIHVAVPMHNLVCDNPEASLIEFGTCHDE